MCYLVLRNILDWTINVIRNGFCSLYNLLLGNIELLHPPPPAVPCSCKAVSCFGPGRRRPPPEGITKNWPRRGNTFRSQPPLLWHDGKPIVADERTKQYNNSCCTHTRLCNKGRKNNRIRLFDSSRDYYTVYHKRQKNWPESGIACRKHTLWNNYSRLGPMRHGENNGSNVMSGLTFQQCNNPISAI